MAEQSVIDQNNLQKRLQIFVAHARFIATIKKIEFNIALRINQNKKKVM